MAIDLSQTAIDPDHGGVPPTRNTEKALNEVLDDLQGNILKSHGRDHSLHLFIKFSTQSADKRQAARTWLSEQAGHVTSASKQRQEAKAYRAALEHLSQRPGDYMSSTDKSPSDIGGIFFGLMLSAHAYRDLQLSDEYTPDDPSFIAGAHERAPFLNDPPPHSWEPKFRDKVHALIILAVDDPSKRLDTLVESLQKELDTLEATYTHEFGTAMRLDSKGRPSPGHTAPVREHFGFVDGISQPLFFADDIEKARTRQGGIDRYDPSAPLGQVLVKDPAGKSTGYGSYFVYRKLKQDVKGFRADELHLATEIAKHTHPESPKPTDDDIALAGAYMVGRFQDGTPVVDRAVPGLGALPNNFTFDSDPDGIRCPLQAHARKTNPRGDKQRQFGVPLTQERARRIVRRAVSYGKPTLSPGPKDGDVGLLFLCAQSSIADQFEFIQAAWANNEDFLRYGTGLDPVIGAEPDSPQPDAGGRAQQVAQPWPKQYGSRNEMDFTSDRPQYADPNFRFSVGERVSMRGGEYFFVPSISALVNFGSLTIS